MIELKREQDDQFLGKRQWWDVGSGCEVLVSLDADVYSLHITDSKKRDVSESIGNKLNSDLRKEYSITAGIDSYFVEIPEEDLMGVLEKISTYMKWLGNGSNKNKGR